MSIRACIHVRNCTYWQINSQGYIYVLYIYTQNRHTYTYTHTKHTYIHTHHYFRDKFKGQISSQAHAHTREACARYMYVYIHVYMYTYVRIWTCMYFRVCTLCIRIYFSCTCIFLCMRVHIAHARSICMYVFISVLMLVGEIIWIYIHTYIDGHV